MQYVSLSRLSVHKHRYLDICRCSFSPAPAALVDSARAHTEQLSRQVHTYALAFHELPAHRYNPHLPPLLHVHFTGNYHPPQGPRHAHKNTGDIHGDVSFVISRRTTELTCRQNPKSFMCNGVTQFDGDDANNTDLVVSYTIEVDGQWGPYLYCNPANISAPRGPWACTVSLSPGGGKGPSIIPSPSPTCNNFTVFNNTCWKGLFPQKMQVNSAGECCAAASAGRKDQWNYDAGSKACSLFTSSFQQEACTGGISGYLTGPSQPTCNCSRVHQTVGREDLVTNGYSGSHPAGGEWYSHPEAGECTGNQKFGDGSGCTWRVVATNAVVQAKCMYGLLDANVVATAPACFNACPQPANLTSTCALQCYSKAVDGMTPEQLSEPWSKAFGGLCPKQPGALQ
jgi:hypothetical protein